MFALSVCLCLTGLSPLAVAADKAPAALHIDFENQPVQGPVQEIKGDGFTIKDLDRATLYVRNATSPGVSGKYLHIESKFVPRVQIRPEKPFASASVDYSRPESSPGVMFYCGRDDGTFVFLPMSGQQGRSTCEADGKPFDVIYMGVKSGVEAWFRVDNIDFK
jgi:hypothetical protein